MRNARRRKRIKTDSVVRGTEREHRNDDPVFVRRKYHEKYLMNEMLSCIHDTGYAFRKTFHFLRTVVYVLAALALWTLILMIVEM